MIAVCTTPTVVRRPSTPPCREGRRSTLAGPPAVRHRWFISADDIDHDSDCRGRVNCCSVVAKLEFTSANEVIAVTAGDEAGLLAQRIDKLFKTVKPKGREFTYEEVAQGCEAIGGTFSKTYAWQLRTGLRTNPTKRHLESLAAFFGVPVGYFFDDEAAARIDEQLELAIAMRDASVRDIALRAMSMDEATRRSIAQIVREVGNIRGGGRTHQRADDTNG